MTCHDIVFGDGMREIRPEMPEEICGSDALAVFPVDDSPVHRKKDRKPKPVKRQRKVKKGTRKVMKLREMLIITSVALPIIMGAVFATVLLRHLPLYITYMAAAYIWMGVVLYANCRRRKR